MATGAANIKAKTKALAKLFTCNSSSIVEQYNYLIGVCHYVVIDVNLSCLLEEIFIKKC
ncbi:hypothetical protein NIES25_14490 [Nostoc linckia NIES-25]|nr:hypothetical protein NIES25_14490 [Nostoc linckia NIES-25]